MSRISIDLDGTLTLGDHSLIHYLQMKPNPLAIEKVNKASADGHEIFVYTARHHIEHDHILEWLDTNGVQYDHLECGKLKADIYIDNNSRIVIEDWGI
jgi:hydroxymethylpyrimidine pyrophosphatase-like HAD family hydrolase